jgi:hypothetical protein
LLSLDVNGLTKHVFQTNGNVSLNNTSDMSAILGVKGSGSTSATTSLLVQNSAGANLLKVRDDGKTAFGSSDIDCTITGTVGSGNRFQFYSFNGYDFGNVLVTGLGNTVRIPRDLGVGFNTQNNVTAVLQADSTTKGFLKPRMTTTEKNAIATPAAGLEVFDTTLGRPCFYSGSAWVTL